jgi:hypothetical protein
MFSNDDKCNTIKFYKLKEVKMAMNSGSQWRRWEPHIHTPGTALNDQFKGEWEQYLTSLEKTSPKIEALAVTDYYLADNYKEIIKHKQQGRLSEIQLIFPNIELRLDAAAKKGFVNIHLLVSPEDSEHIEQLERILSRLTFQAFGDVFNCNRSDLIRLGKCADAKIIDNNSALSYGATQFKVNFASLKKVYTESDWAKANILIAVAGGSGDGSSGLNQAADKTLRQEIETFAHIIFSGNTKQREFWLGQGGLSVDALKVRYKGCKPCLHGSDAHELDKVGVPDQDRYSWIKGALEFDALRQACIDPEGRAFVGSEPPPSAMPSQVISRVKISNADWAATPDIELNTGLIAIIGARGSGKTALADMIAAGCDSINPNNSTNENTSPSFLTRAAPLLGQAEIQLMWGGGDESTRSLVGDNSNVNSTYPRARYLSQQFVEELCSSNKMSDGLIEEIERVILDSYDIDERNGAVNFNEFREFKANRFQQARTRESTALLNLSNRISFEMEKEKSIFSLNQQVVNKKALIQNYRSDLSKLVVKGDAAHVTRHTELGLVAQSLRSKIQGYTNQRATFIALQDEVISTRATMAPEQLRQAQARHTNSGLSAQQWDEFLLEYKGSVDTSLQNYLKWADENISKLNGEPTQVISPDIPLIAGNADLSTLGLFIVNAEMGRLEALFSADKVTRDQYAALNKRIENGEAALKLLETKLLDAKGAMARKREMQAERDDSYKRVFEAIINEQNVLSELYAPLMKRLTVATGTLNKLGFYVQRIVNVRQWAYFAEQNLFDLRKSGDFSGRGSLTTIVEATLKPLWETGSAQEIQDGIKGFIDQYFEEMLSNASYDKTNPSEYNNWLKKFALWLYGTDHISIRYEILYDGTGIQKLSPGTRGIVLLLLYLALDDNDDRPLIIDQPEENLDPKSVNDELVPLFIAAKSRRQVIIVTHNANLVINTDADQIIIAESGPHINGGLPSISYQSGGLENEAIRKSVRDILEGGETAFQERARRLRVRLDR